MGEMITINFDTQVLGDIERNLYRFIGFKGVICKSPWIKVDMVALFLPQDVAQL